MAGYGNAQAVEFVEPDIVDRPGLSIGEDHGLSDEFGLHLLQSGEDRRRAVLDSGHGHLRERYGEPPLQFKGAQVVTGARRTGVGSNPLGSQFDQRWISENPLAYRSPQEAPVRSRQTGSP